MFIKQSFAPICRCKLRLQLLVMVLAVAQMVQSLVVAEASLRVPEYAH